MRLSASSFAGTARTLVAVGSSSEACMFLAIAPAAPRSGLTVTSSASSWDFAGVVDPAAGLVSAEESAERVLAEPLVPGRRGCGEDDAADGATDDAALVGALPFVPLPFVADAGVLALPLPDAEPPEEEPPDEEPPDEEPPDEEADPADDTVPVDAPVEDAELAPAVFSPSAGA